MLAGLDEILLLADDQFFALSFFVTGVTKNASKRASSLSGKAEAAAESPSQVAARVVQRVAASAI